MQGEAEGYENSAESYLARFGGVRAPYARSAGTAQPALPHRADQPLRGGPVRSAGPPVGHGARGPAAGALCAARRVAVVPSADLALYDFIHNAAASNLVVGERCARAALAVCYGRAIDWEAPEPEEARLIAPDTVIARPSAASATGSTPTSVPALANCPSTRRTMRGLVHPSAYVTGTDCLTLTFPRPLVGAGTAARRVAHEPRPRHSHATACGMPMLSFYGVPVTG